MKYLWVAVLLSATAGALGLVHPFGNPRVGQVEARGHLLEGANLPPQAKALLIAKCADCHSNETRWPIYARVAPGSWLIERDIVQARKQMNLSRWRELSTDQQQVLLAQISHVAKNHAMPPLTYVALHGQTKLSMADVHTLIMLSGPLLEDAASTTPGPGDAAEGKRVFEKRCTGCHAIEDNREGPKLAGVYGRTAGTVPGFSYSQGLQRSGLVWNETTLEKWLSGPDQLVPDTKMDFYVPKAEERRDLIAFLKSAPGKTSL